MNRKKIILFDIDYTLFDTDKFRDLTYAKLMDLLQQEDTPEYHNKVKEVETLLIANAEYEPLAFTKILAKALAIQPESIEIENLFYDKSLYDICLYPEAKEVLQIIKDKANFIMGIISKGELSFQKRKIAPVEQFFLKEDIIISNNKFDELDKLLEKYGSQKILVIDDSAPFLDTVHQASSNFITCLMEKENRYEKRKTPPDFSSDFKIKNLHEVIGILDNIDWS